MINVWHQCYIDLIRGQGVAIAAIEENEKVLFCRHALVPETTINQLGLFSCLIAFSSLVDGKNIHVIGNNKYVDRVIDNISKWCEDEMIDTKAHSQLLKTLNTEMDRQLNITSEYHTSRSWHPMLWALSQYSAHFYSEAQKEYAKTGSYNFRAGIQNVHLSEDETIDSFCRKKINKPLTDLQLEKLIQKEKMKQKVDPIPIFNLEQNNVVSLAAFRAAK